MEETLKSDGSLAGVRIGLLTAAASRRGGGVFEAVVNHAAMIRGCGGDAFVFGLADAYGEEDAHRFAPSLVRYGSILGPVQIGFAPKLVNMLIEARLDLLHLHGIWMYPSRAGAVWARRTGKPYVISPHGMLDPWITSRGRIKKTIARIGYERSSWRTSSGIHALTKRESADITRESGCVDVVIIPNAGPGIQSTPSLKRKPNFLYLGRIHPKKNIGALVRAWTARTEALESVGAKLTIAGWGELAHVAELEAELRDGPPSIQFVGPLYGDAKQQLYADARFFVLPSLSEGLPMVVLEAWAASTPVIMTSECNLPEGFNAGAAIECGADEATIGECLERAIAMDEREWGTMALAAKLLAEGRFSASAVAARWAIYYRSLIETGAQEGGGG